MLDNALEALSIDDGLYSTKKICPALKSVREGAVVGRIHQRQLTDIGSWIEIEMTATIASDISEGVFTAVIYIVLPGSDNGGPLTATAAACGRG
jgi:hypothetical protein